MMQTIEPKKVDPNFRLITSTLQAKLLTESRYLRVLRQIINEAKSVSQIAQSIDESLETTAYRVKQLVQAQIVKSEKSISKQKYYKAHPYWQIPSELLNAISFEEFMLSFFQTSMRRVFTAMAQHLHITNEPWILQMNFCSTQFLDFLPRADRLEWLPILESSILCLDKQDAFELQREMLALSEKYRKRHKATEGEPHLFGLMFTQT